MGKRSKTMHAHLQRQSVDDVEFFAAILLVFLAVVTVSVVALTHPVGFFSFVWG
jgi:hypothetical protein